MSHGGGTSDRITLRSITNVVLGGRNSSGGSVLSSLSCVMQRRQVRSSSQLPVQAVFPAGVNMGSDSIHPKTLSDESIKRGPVCEHMHSIARTQKILTFMPYTGECRQQIHTQHAPSTKTECDYLYGWIKKKTVT